jgi:hypothetical protein
LPAGHFSTFSAFLTGVKKTTACMTIRRVSRALVAKADQLVAMPTKAEMRASSEKLFDKFFDKFKIPNCPHGIDLERHRPHQSFRQALCPKCRMRLKYKVITHLHKLKTQ